MIAEHDTLDDLTISWRFDQLAAAGYQFPVACELAIRRDIDLHQAVELAAAAGPETAARILV